MIAPVCRLGGSCELVSREALLGKPAVAQCVKCSLVYEAASWRLRHCDHCGLDWGESLHDPCLGELPGVAAACCGHGDESKRYVNHRKLT